MVTEIPRTSSEDTNLEATLGVILKSAIKAIGGSAGVVATWSEAEHRFVVSVSQGLDATVLSQLRPLLNEAAPDLAGSKDSFTLISDLRPDSALPLSDHGITQDPIIALPLQIGGQWLGLIYILRPSSAIAFTRAEQPILAAFAEQAAIAVQNAKLAHSLAEEKRRIESILESSADGIMSVDSRRRIIGYNQSMEKITGFSRTEALGQECYRILNLRNQDDNSICNTQCPMLMNSKTSTPTEVWGIIKGKNNQDIDVSMIYSKVYTLDGKPINAVINIRDMSKVRELENLRETFLSMLGHELQTPLSIIKGYASTLANSSKWSQETLQNGLNAIEQESDRLTKMVNKLLLASRMSSGTQILEKEIVDLPSLAGKVIRRLGPVSSSHTFDIDFEPDFPAVMAEPQLIEEVMTNLVENAIKYSPDGGAIRIYGRQNDGEVKITVSDQGIGIPEADQEHIFERFYRVDSETTQRLKGVGLGLFICRSIVETHGGRIEVSSKPGEGSHFSFTLPLPEK